MIIGFDAKRLFCNTTGLGNYSRTLVRNYSELDGNTFILYSSKDKNLSESQYFKKSKFFVSKFNDSFLWRSKGIVKDLISDKVQVYHGLSNEIPFGIHKTEIKTVVTVHDLIFKVYPNTYPLIDRLIYDFKFRYACKHADQIIAISESTKNDIIKYYGTSASKIKVIPQTTLEEYWEEDDLKLQDLLIKEFNLPSNFMLSVGTIEERKNLRSVIQALAKLEVKIPLVIVGGGKSYKNDILKLIESLDLKKWVFFIPRRINNRELKNIYSLAKFSIYPSLYEGFGLPVLESRLSKTPVITSDISSLPEAAGDDNQCVNPLNIEELKNAMQLYINQDLTELSIQTQKSAIEDFGKNKLNKLLNSLYYELLDD